VDRYWKTDRITAYEAPPETASKRKTRDVELRFRGRVTDHVLHARVPAGMPLPDVITFKGHVLVHRSDDSYSEASMWPIVEGLDT
jgi:hypothetical protein